MRLNSHIPRGKEGVSILFMVIVVEMCNMPHKMRGRFNNQSTNPPIGADEERRVNIISVDGSESEVDVMANKRTRQERGKEIEEEGELRKKKGKTKVDDKPGSSKPKRKQRSIYQHDFNLGKGVEEYDLVKDVCKSKGDEHNFWRGSFSQF